MPIIQNSKILQYLQRIFILWIRGSTFRDVLEPIATARVSIKTLSLSVVRVGATKLARFRREQRRRVGAYTRIYPVNWSKIKAETITGGGDPLPASLSLSLSRHPQGFLGKRKEEGNRVCNLFRPIHLPLSLSLSSSLNSEEHRW